MAIERIKQYLAEYGLEDRVMEFGVSSATVELAAEAVGAPPARIAKTLSFKRGEGCMLIVLAGDTRIDNTKFKARFGMKAVMLRPEEVAALLGQPVGGVQALSTVLQRHAVLETHKEYVFVEPLRPDPWVPAPHYPGTKP